MGPVIGATLIRIDTLHWQKLLVVFLRSSQALQPSKESSLKVLLLNQARLVMPWNRTRLASRTMQALMCLKIWMKQEYSEVKYVVEIDESEIDDEDNFD